MSLSKKKLVVNTPSTTFHVFGIVTKKLSVAINVSKARNPE